MRATALGIVFALAATTLALVAPGETPADAACKSPMAPGRWTGAVTQEMVVDGTADTGMVVDETGSLVGDFAVKVRCNGKVKGSFVRGSFTLDATFSIAGFSTPLQCTGTSGERPVVGKVRKGAGGTPVIELTYGASVAETFECTPGPFGDALNAAFAESDTTTASTPDGSPTGIRLPATDATKTTVSGTSFEATGGFDPIAIATESLQSLGLTPQITQAFEFTRE